MLADESATVSMILDTLSVNMAEGYDNSYCLCYPTGEKIKDTELMWNVLREISQHDALIYRPISKKLGISCSIPLFKNVFIEVEIDFSQPLANYVHLFCRKFGIRYHEFSCCKLENQGESY